jgi:ribose/xylose/arabinose/galactoside ABC-type transport system permease subunit
MKKVLELIFSRLLTDRVFFLLALLAVIMVILSALSQYFLNVETILDITRIGAVLALVSMGQSLIILAGGAGIDLSVGSMVSLAGVLFGVLVKAGVNIWLAAGLTLIIGGMLGMINSITVAWWGIPPLVGTLGTMWIYGAIALVITNGVPVSGFPKEFAFLGDGRILEVPAQILLVVIPVYLILQVVLSRTYLGRWIYLIGVNSEAARFSGIPVTRVRFLLYTLSGVLSGLGAVVMASWLMAARPDVGSGLELQSITVTVLGGTYIFGGYGSLAGTILAVLIVTLVASGLQLGNINTIWQLAVLGFILLGAVALNQVILQRESKRLGISS